MMMDHNHFKHQLMSLHQLCLSPQHHQFRLLPKMIIFTEPIRKVLLRKVLTRVTVMMMMVHFRMSVNLTKVVRARMTQSQFKSNLLCKHLEKERERKERKLKILIIVHLIVIWLMHQVIPRVIL